MFFLCSVIGGFLLALLVTLGVNDKRFSCRPYLIFLGISIAISGCIAAAAWMTFPFTWGLPPNWLPTKWNPCPKDYRQDLPHGETVSQQVQSTITQCGGPLPKNSLVGEPSKVIKFPLTVIRGPLLKITTPYEFWWCRLWLWSPRGL
jgi:hypothetical protein